MLAIVASIGTICATEGALLGLFSVSAEKQVYFSQGNLQYQASTDTWRFAENQFDTIGAANVNISATYDGWIDMFGWGTGDNPTLTSPYNDQDYPTFVDWGVNAISNGGNEANLWRTLSSDEWTYIYRNRANASSLYGLATVNGINGLVVLPDKWNTIAGISFIPGHEGGFSQNTYSEEAWLTLESAGAVFLPAAGDRDPANVRYVGEKGRYWSSDAGSEPYIAFCLDFDESYVAPQSGIGRSGGLSIRLVQEKANSQTGGNTPIFPGDPGTLTLNLELKAAVVDGDELPDYAPTGAGGYPQGTSVTITAQDIPGYAFVRWSDEVTDKSRTFVLNKSMTLTALYSHSMIAIPVAANKWTFICLPPLGNRQYTQDMFTYEGLTDVQWGTYNGTKRAAGQSGWETPETFNALQGYILYSTTAGTLRINAYQDEIRQGESGNTVYAGMTAYASSHPENESWNFLGNPYSQGYNIAGFAAAGIESPITVWNGTGYTTYTPGIDSYILNPFEAFFIQKAEGAEGITFSREYLDGNNGGNGSSIVEGALSGYFSVGEGVKVQFSKGNLQYQASTDTWRFAENQYDTIGAFNANISNTYDGWIDMFGWGTGNNPTNSSADDNDYSTFTDWGVNAISNGGNEANLWRTLNSDEWVYLFQTRTNAAALYGLATVCGINGMIILLDDWQSVSGISFTSGTGEFSQNTYSLEQWSKMESSGAVFLPATGYRNDTGVGNVGASGTYWSATPHNKNAYGIIFSSSLNPQRGFFPSTGYSVRLVR